MKKLAGVAVFVVTLVVALLVTRYYAPRPEPPPPPIAPIAADPVLFPEPPPPPPSRAKVTYKVQLVTLDVAARKSHATLVLERAPEAPAPERLWVWAGFFVPGDAGGEVFAGAPVLVEKPFAGGATRATVNVTGACPWCGQGDAPAAGYYARVNVSAESAADAQLADEEVSRVLSTATQVVVEEGRRRSR
jgi:hypothetical protein